MEISKYARSNYNSDIRLSALKLEQLASHLSTHSLLSIYQSAYRSGHSTETVLLHIVNDLLTSLHEYKISILSFLDLSAALDTIDHEILLSHFKHARKEENLFASDIKMYRGICLGDVPVIQCITK